MRGRLEKRIRKVITLSLSSVFAIVVIIAAIFIYRHIIEEADDMLIYYAAMEKIEMQHSFYPPPPPRASRSFFLSPFSHKTIVMVRLGGNEVVENNVVNISADAESSLLTSLIEIEEKGREKGSISFYRYLRNQNSDGSVTYYLMNIQEALFTFLSFLLALIIVFCAGIFIVLLISSLFSKRILKPIVEGYEKQRMFITDAGHELRTPLTIISADCEVLELDGGKSEWTDDIKRQVERLSDLTRDLVYLSKLEEEGRKDMIILPLSEIVSEAVTSFVTVAKKEGKTISANIESMIELKGDLRSLERLVYVLLDNAVKYSAAKDVIKVVLKRDAKNIQLSVSNKTEEKNLENLDLLFERFYRADRARSSENKGYGIGLAIAKAVVENHKGRISASKDGDDGIIISILFPAAKKLE